MVEQMGWFGSAAGAVPCGATAVIVEPQGDRVLDVPRGRGSGGVAAVPGAGRDVAPGAVDELVGDTIVAVTSSTVCPLESLLLVIDDSITTYLLITTTTQSSCHLQ